MDEPNVISRRHAQALVDARRWLEARDLLGPLLASRPDDAQLRCLLAVCLLRLDDPAGCVREAEAAAAADPTMDWPHRLRSAAFLRLKAPRHALEAASQAERLAPRNPWVQLTLADAALSSGDTDLAAAAAVRARELAPHLAASHVVMGNVCLRLNQHSSAEGHFREALRLDPEHAGAMNNLGVALKKQGLHAGALATYSEAARLDPRLQVARENATAIIGADAAGTRLIASVLVLALVAWTGAPLLPALAGLVIVWMFVLLRRLRRSRGALGSEYQHLYPTAGVLRRLRAEARRPSQSSMGWRLVAVGTVFVAALSLDFPEMSLEEPKHYGVLIGAWIVGCALFAVGGIACLRSMRRKA